MKLVNVAGIHMVYLKIWRNTIKIHQTYQTSIGENKMHSTFRFKRIILRDSQAIFRKTVKSSIPLCPSMPSFQVYILLVTKVYGTRRRKEVDRKPHVRLINLCDIQP